MVMGRSTAIFLFIHLWIGGLSLPELSRASIWTASAWAEGSMEAENAYFYDSVGKRDPFLSPFHIAPEQNVVAEITTPLQRFHLEQLKLVGVVWQTSRPKALIEDEEGLGYIVESGTRIGANGGVIRTIEPGRIVVEEYETNFSGKRWARQRALRLAVADGPPTGGETNPNR